MLGDKVRVHVNLHKKDFTISTYIKGRGWIKAASSPQVYLEDVEFRVSERGRQRALMQGRRNVHAFAYGKLYQYKFDHPQLLVGSRQLTYNPFKHATFVDEQGKEVTRAALVMFDNEYGVQAWGVVH